MKFERKLARQSRVAEPIQAVAEVVPAAQAPKGPKDAALDQIAKYVKSKDFGRVRATALRAQSAGLLSDDDISDAIDAALPGQDEIEHLSPHHAIAVALAAGPSRHTDYSPLLAKHMGTLPPEVLSQLGLDSPD